MTTTSGTRGTKIAILGSRGIPARYGGYETIAQELAPRLVKAGFDVYVSCETSSLRFGRHSYKGVNLFDFPVIRAIRNISETILYDAASVFWASFAVDIIYMLGYSSAITLFFPKLFRKTVIVNVDGLESQRRKFNIVFRFVYHTFEVLSAKIADYVVVDSHAIGRYYQRLYGVIPTYIPNGISEAAPLNPNVLQHFGLIPQDYYLVIARLIPDNNIDLILEGFAKSRSIKKLVIVGPLDKTRYVEKLLLHKNERVLFLGGIYEPRLQRTLRHNCYAYIHGHEKGGTNPSLVEALSCNNIIISIDVVFNREVARQSALYFTTADELMQKIDSLENGLDKLPGLRDGYAIYKAGYTSDIAAEEFIRLIREHVKAKVCDSKSEIVTESLILARHYDRG